MRVRRHPLTISMFLTISTTRRLFGRYNLAQFFSSFWGFLHFIFNIPLYLLLFDRVAYSEGGLVWM